MLYGEIKTLKAQVEHVLRVYPETRNSDNDLTLRVAGLFQHDAVDTKDSVARCRRWFNEEKHDQHGRIIKPRQYLPTIEEVARQRGLNIDEWRVAMGYPTQSGSWEAPSVQEQKKIHKYPSRTKRGIYYNAIETEYGIICDCEGYQFRHTCKHVKLAEREVMRASMTPLF